MPLVFSYGSLQQPDVQRATFGRLLDGRPDALRGWTLTQVPIEDPEIARALGRTHHANLAAAPDARVEGMAFELSDAELLTADAYEREADYVRVQVRLTSGIDAWIYVHSSSATAGSTANGSRRR